MVYPASPAGLVLRSRLVFTDEVKWRLRFGAESAAFQTADSDLRDSFSVSASSRSARYLHDWASRRE